MSATDKPYQVDTYGYTVPTLSLPVVNPDLSKDISGVTPTQEVKPATKTNLWTYIFIGLVIFIYLSLVYVAGYHAYTEYADDAPHIKWLRILVAIILAPIYIAYVLMKSFFIEFLKSDANSYNFSLIDYLLGMFSFKTNPNKNLSYNKYGRY